MVNIYINQENGHLELKSVLAEPIFTTVFIERTVMEITQLSTRIQNKKASQFMLYIIEAFMKSN